MKVVDPSFQLHTYHGPLTPEEGVKLLRWVEWNGRISHRTEESHYTEESWKTFIPAHVISHGDWSITEHSHVTAIIRTDRGITHEIVRHRLFSFTQESTRFVSGKKKYPAGLEFVKPSMLSERGEWYWKDSLTLAQKNYLDMLEEGVRPQEARSVLPNSLATTITVTGNLRSWRWFFLARTTQETHPDFRRWSIPMLGEFQRCIPYLYSDITPMEKQSISMAKVH